MQPPPDPDLPPPDLTGRPLRIDKLRDGDSVIIALSGELDSATADQVDAVIRGAEETDIGRIVVSLSAVHFIDSTALSMLLAAKRRNDGRLSYIPSKDDSVTRLLELTGTIEMLG